MHSLLMPPFLDQIVEPPEKAQHVLIRRRVPAFTLERLMARLGVSTVKHVKVDVEGFDVHIILALVNHMKKHRFFRPLEISWECVHLSPLDRRRSLRVLSRMGYDCGIVTAKDCGCSFGSWEFSYHTQ
eukprot:TRINITY_DN34116_c0_g1_i1.p1 TRINITY_DN34116_c0_g1~~TRINITY_DN34116_c0_g1_i1.p1  ORF type:complete len:128 (-),score=8.44 TRINITY_DN34116_c0_g1_i1:69-452(-)